MTRPSFDVLTEPWIPVIRHDGSHEQLGIVPCLERAHELREIRDTSPIVEFGLYRLLVAFVLDALILAGRRPEDGTDLKELIRGERFDSDMIKKYIAECGDVFNLFHPERPFLQTVMKTSTSKPLAGLYPVTPSGTNVSHWHHDSENNMSVPAKKAVCLLCTIAPFMTAGGAGLSPSINGAPAVYALPVRESLFKTIVLNVPLRNNRDGGDGMIAWRENRTPGSERSQATMVEALTWRPRRIQLIPETDPSGGVRVRTMKFEKGDSTRLSWIDPGLAYRYDNDKTTPVRMRENRPLWRDAGPLVLLNEHEYGRDKEKVEYKRPDIIEQAFHVVDTGDQLVIQVYGMRTDMKMKVFEWAKSVWSVPAGLGRFTRLGSLVQDELDRAEKCAFSLRTCIKVLYPREGAGNKNALGKLADRCERAYWQRLEYQFQPLMDAFAALDPDAPDDPALVDETARNWRESIRNIAHEQFESAAKDMDADGDALERQVNARTRLYKSLRKVLP